MAAMPGSSTLDAQLFSIRHLLILKEMIRTIDLVHVERGPDFYSVSGEPNLVLSAPKAYADS